MKCRIGDLCITMGSGGTPSRKKKEFYENGTIRWLKTKELDDGNIYDTEEYITGEALKSSSAKLYPKNTITMAMYGATVGKLGVLKNECATNQACCNMVVDPKKADYKFLYYSLLFNREQLINLANGAAQQNLNKGIIENYEIEYYELYEQKAIAHILSTLDEKIEVNNQINKKLEEMAQAIFKHWFIDFEFPNEDGEPYKSSGGEMVGSEPGMIPKGWEVGNLSELVSVRYGKDHKKLADGKIPVYGSGGVMRYVDTALYSTESVLIPRKGTLNNIIYINEPFWSVDTMFFTEMKFPHIAKYIYFFMKSKDLISMNVGSAVPSMTTEVLNNMRVIISSEEIMRQYDEIVTPIFNKMKIHIEENTVLTSLRDTLLSKLMSGEIRVPLKLNVGY